MDEKSQDKWCAFEKGETLGKSGSECGIIIWDEEHPDGARMTIESNGHVAPFSITLGIYGWIFYNVFFNTLEETRDTFQRMKPEIEGILELTKQDMPEATKKRNVDAAIKELIKRYPTRPETSL